MSKTDTPTGDNSKGRPGRPAGELFPHVYQELRTLAAAYMNKEQANHTLQPTALVHETFVRLAASGNCPWKSEAEFIAIAATVMRRVLVDHARRRDAAKRGGGRKALTIDSRGSAPAHGSGEVDVLILDDALQVLETLHPRQARLVELRVFGGLSIEAAAMLLGVVPSTAYLDWDMAKAWLMRAMEK